MIKSHNELNPILYNKGMKHLSFLLVVALLNGCSMKLKPHSSQWDAPKRKHPRYESQPTLNPPKNPKRRTTRPRLNRVQSLSDAGYEVVETAKQYLGVPYRWGGESLEEGGFDCSGLVYFVFAKHGIQLKRTADLQFLQGVPIAKSDLEPGDLVFFSSNGKTITHVGIYSGDEQFIHAPRTGRNVSFDSLNSTYYKRVYKGARRILL